MALLCTLVITTRDMPTPDLPHPSSYTSFLGTTDPPPAQPANTPQVDHTSERYQEMKRSLLASEADAARLRERSAQLNTLLVETQRSLGEQQELSMQRHGEAMALQAACDNLRAEKELLAAAEKRMTQENEVLLAERRSSNSLLTNLQGLQNEMKRQEHEMKERLMARVDDLQKETVLLRHRAEEEAERLRLAALRHEQQQQEMRAELSSERDAHHATRESLVAATCRGEALSKEAILLKEQLDASQRRVTMLVSSSTGGGGAEEGAEALGGEGAAERQASSQQQSLLQQQLATSMAEIEQLNGQLREARESAEQYRVISQAAEQTLKEMNASTAEFRTATEARNSEHEATVADLRGRLKTAEEQASAASQQLQALEAKLFTVQQDAASRQATASEAVASATAASEAAMARAATAQEEFLAQAKLAEEATDKCVPFTTRLLPCPVPRRASACVSLLSACVSLLSPHTTPPHTVHVHRAGVVVRCLSSNLHNLVMPLPSPPSLLSLSPSLPSSSSRSSLLSLSLSLSLSSPLS